MSRAWWHRRIWKVAAPIMLSNLTLPVVGAVDTAMAGHLPGPEFLGGVGVAALIFSFTFWTFGFLRLSTTSYVAQAFGRGERAEVKAVVMRAGILALAISLPLLAFQGPILHAALYLIEAGGAVSQQATLYFDVRIWAAPAVLGNFVVFGVLIGLQRTGTALAVQAAVASVNVILDLLFVLEFGWQVPGLAAATLVSEYAGLGLGVAALLAVLPGGRRTWPLDKALRLAAYRPLLGLNRDLLIRTVTLSLAFAVFVSLSARIDDTTLAANEVLMMFMTFAAFALDGFANACEAIVGQACGRRDPAMLRAAVGVSFFWAGATAVVACLIFLLAGGLFIDLMTDVPEVRQLARTYMPYAALMPLVGVWSFQLDGIFIGAARGRDIRNAMLISVAVYVPAIVMLERTLGNDGLWIGLMLLFAMRALTLFVRYPSLVNDVDASLLGRSSPM